jgi:diguanylate cyclase (GGDEF)-like protein/PAS domain S-box-containing protein
MGDARTAGPPGAPCAPGATGGTAAGGAGIAPDDLPGGLPAVLPDGLFRTLVDGAADGILVVGPDQRIAYANAAADAMFGRAPGGLRGVPLDRLLPERARAGHAALVDGFAAGAGAARTMEERGTEIAARRADGSEFPVHISILRLGEGKSADAAGSGTPLLAAPLLAAIVRDVSRQKALEAELTRLAERDTLTGIDNRRTFCTAVEREIARARRYGRPLALAMIDIDRFKRVNDGFGHAAGDAVIRHVVQTVGFGLRRHDLFGRWGGEEFAVALPEAGPEFAGAIAERIRRSVEASPTRLPGGGGLPVAVTVSIGISALAPGETLEALADRADRAMYAAKEAGRNRVAVAPPPEAADGTPELRATARG